MKVFVQNERIINHRLDKCFPKGTLNVECGKMPVDHGYRIKILNIVNFQNTNFCSRLCSVAVSGGSGNYSYQWEWAYKSYIYEIEKFTGEERFYEYTTATLTYWNATMDHNGSCVLCVITDKTTGETVTSKGLPIKCDSPLLFTYLIPHLREFLYYIFHVRVHRLQPFFVGTCEAFRGEAGGDGAAVEGILTAGGEASALPDACGDGVLKDLAFTHVRSQYNDLAVSIWIEEEKLDGIAFVKTPDLIPCQDMKAGVAYWLCGVKTVHGGHGR